MKNLILIAFFAFVSCSKSIESPSAESLTEIEHTIFICDEWGIVDSTVIYRGGFKSEAATKPADLAIKVSRKVCIRGHFEKLSK